MKQALIITTIGLYTLFMLSGIYDPSNPIMWLASADQQFTVIRASIIIILGSLLFYKPPRSTVFRTLLAVIALALGVGTVSMINTYTIQLFDALLFLEVTILLLIEAAEIQVATEPQQALEKRRTISARRPVRVVHAG